MSNLIPKKLALTKYTMIVPYLLPDEIRRMIVTAEQHKTGYRDVLLIIHFFITGLRISEALSSTLTNLERPREESPMKNNLSITSASFSVYFS